MNKFFAIVFLIPAFIFSQVPPPPCNANGNTGFGGAVGEGHILFSGDGNNPIIFGMTTNTNEMNDILVLYIDTGAPGRNVIDLSVDDSADDHRIAITNSNIYGNGNSISFPSGFEASYAIAVDINFGGLWAIPNTGSVGSGELNFITSVNSNLTSSTQVFYNFTFNWEDIGLTTNDEFHFVGLYVSNTACNSDEGYGEGLIEGKECKDNITFTGYLTLPGCGATLSDTDNSFNNIEAYFINGELFIKGLNETAVISVYDVFGRTLHKKNHLVEQLNPIPLNLNKNQLQFIVIESFDYEKVLKVIPH